MTSWAYTKEMKDQLNSRVLRDCPLNGQEIVDERMRVRNWSINIRNGNNLDFIEHFKGDEYDLQKRKSELQKIVNPIHRIKYFSCEEIN